MKTAIKTEFLCVKPRSSLAKDRFDNRMDRLHSCRVTKRKHGKVFLESISNRYSTISGTKLITYHQETPHDS